MSTPVLPGRTNRELLKALRPPVARFYPFDLHTHSLGSHDVCHGGHFLSLPEELRESISTPQLEAGASIGDEGQIAVQASTRPVLPLSKTPADQHQHDCDMARPEFLEAFYKSLCSRRDTLAENESISPSDNWCLVGITDHNTAEFSTRLSDLAWSRRSHDRLIILPGIELEVHVPLEGAAGHCPLHILCLFKPGTKSSDMRLAINQSTGVPVSNWKLGVPLALTNLPAFIQALRSHQDYPVACVAAHVWSSKGIAKEPKKLILEALDAELTRLQGELVRASHDSNYECRSDIEREIKSCRERKTDADGIHLTVLELMGKCGFDGLQVRDHSHDAHYRRLHRFRDHQGRAVPVVCSDSHTPSTVFQAGDCIPYIKLNVDVLSSGDASSVFAEVRDRALRFGETRTTYTTPGRVTYWIEGIEIVPDAEDARRFLTSRSEEASLGPSEASFVLPLSRNLNCFIGGRGSGKSALIEAIAFLADGDRFAQEGAKRNETSREEWYRRADATLRGCRLRLVWKTTHSGGIGTLAKKALFVTRYFDPDGRHPDAECRDLEGDAIVDSSIKPPRVQLLRAHDIEQTAHTDNLRSLFDELCGAKVEELSHLIQSTRAELAGQRRVLVDCCQQVNELTREGGPLRQYGVRRKQFEAVDRPELRQRFEQVDQAEAVSRAAATTCQALAACDAVATIGKLESDLGTVFDHACALVADAKGIVRPGHEELHIAVRPDVSSDGQSVREGMLSAVRAASKAIHSGSELLQTIGSSAELFLKERRDELARDGLPTGASEREAKKKAFEEAKADHQKYQELLAQFSELLAERRSVFDRLVTFCRERTELRTAHAESVTAQLRRDLDQDVLRIEVHARPHAERRELAEWLDRNIGAVFVRFRQQRLAALLDSGIMPVELRDMLLHPDTPDTSTLFNARERAEDGRITREDCDKIVDSCRGRKTVAIDGVDQFSEEFEASLPEDLKRGVLLFPLSVSTLAIDHVLQLDEVVLDDIPDVLLNDRPNDPGSEFRPLLNLSPGQRCSAILPLLLLSGDYPLVIDQPEDNLDNRLIRQVIVNILASMKLRRQVIIATHNPNLPVLGDAEQCVVLQASGRDLSRVVAVGDLDSPNVARYITDIMEGGREAFQYRQSIYQAHWGGGVGS